MNRKCRPHFDFANCHPRTTHEWLTSKGFLSFVECCYTKPLVYVNVVMFFMQIDANRRWHSPLKLYHSLLLAKLKMELTTVFQTVSTLPRIRTSLSVQAYRQTVSECIYWLKVYVSLFNVKAKRKYKINIIGLILPYQHTLRGWE